MNVLIALLDEDHPRHDAARSWFEYNSGQGWASCPLAQNGCIRILSQPRYPNPLGILGVVERLRGLTSTTNHEFVPDDISLLTESVVEISRVSGHRELTDVYLLALAVAHGFRLVTLDTGIRLVAVEGARERHLVVI